MAPHTPFSARRGAALSAGMTVAAVAAALAAAPAASAAQVLPTGPLEGAGETLPGPAAGAAGALTNSVSGIGYLKNHQLNPLANTGVDPLANGVGTQVADFKPVSTELVTGPLSRGGALKDLPVVGAVAKLLPV
jgi:hypothetical protein